MFRTSFLVVLVVFWSFPESVIHASDFQHEIIDAEPGKVCYAVTTADVNGDSKLDAVVVTENRVLWYEAPSWKRHVLLDGVTVSDNVCIAAHDIDADGKIDFALGAGWPQSGGSIGWISRDSSGGASKPWNYYSIGAAPWTHRMRFGDVLGTGAGQLVVSALNASEDKGARLLAFEIPTDPRSDRWKLTEFCSDAQRMHNHWCLNKNELLGGNSSGSVSTLIAAQDGVSLVSKDPTTDAWQRRMLNVGDDVVAGNGAGEVKPGKLSDGTSLLVTIEPMHGNAAVAYEFSNGIQSPAKQRTVLDDQLGQGHAVWCADFDRDGDDEIVIGHRAPGSGDPAGPGVYLFDRRGDAWVKQIIDDGEMACEDLVVADLNGDGLLDILAGGRATHNVKIYFQK